MYVFIVWNNKILPKIQSATGKLKISEFYDAYVEFSYALEKVFKRL